MKWRILIAINAVLLVVGFLLAWAWERGVVWGRPPSVLYVDLYRTQADAYRFRLHPSKIEWEHLTTDPNAPTDFTHGGGISRNAKCLVFEYQALSSVTMRPGTSQLVGGMHYAFCAPYWSLLLIWAMPAVPCGLALKREWIRRYRLRRGLCQQCGYDLRASSGRCPDCGREFDPQDLPAPKPLSEPLLQDETAPPVDVPTLLWSVLLAMLVPWRVFPAVRRMRLRPLVIVYLLTVAANLAVTFYDYPWQTAGVPRWQSVLMGQITSFAWGLVTVYVLLTLAVASRQQRARETLAIGLRFALVARASVFPYFITLYGIWRLLGPPSQPQTWIMLLQVGLWVYSTAAMSLSAAWLADHEHAAADPSDPLWPRCVRCEYSLRGLPAADAWLADRQGGTPTATIAGNPSAECPECGMSIADSLAECDLQLLRRKALGAAVPRHVTWKTLLAGLFTLRFSRLGAWLINARRTTAVALWLVVAVIPATALTIPVFNRTNSLLMYPYCWEKVLLWTGMAGLLAGLWISRRIRANVLYLAQHALVPGTCIGGLLYAIVQTKYQGAWMLFPGGPFLPMALIVLVVELALLAKVYRLMRPPRRSDEHDQKHPASESPAART